MPYVDIDLDEVTTRELIDALEERWIDTYEKQSLLSIVKTDECQKLSLFLNVMDRYSLLELETIFKEKYEAMGEVKEQLKLFPL